MYNSETKKWFLDETYEDSTIEVVIRYFNRIAKVEEIYDTDSVNFSNEQVIDMYKSTNYKSRDTIRSLNNYLNRYYEWASKQGLVDNLENPYRLENFNFILNAVLPHEAVDDRFFSYNKLLEDLNKIKLYSNKLIYYGLYLGFTPDEIVGMKATDLDNENKLMLLQDNKSRKIDDLFIEIVNKSYTEDTSLDSAFDDNNERKIEHYIDTPFIIKALRTNALEGDGRISHHNYFIRMRKIKSEIGNKNINSTTLFFNGLVNNVINNVKENGYDFISGFDKKVRIETGYSKYIINDIIRESIAEFGSKMSVEVFRMKVREHLDQYID